MTFERPVAILCLELISNAYACVESSSSGVVIKLFVHKCIQSAEKCNPWYTTRYEINSEFPRMSYEEDVLPEENNNNIIQGFLHGW